MKKNKTLKRTMVGLLAVVMAVTMIAPTVLAKEYEDEYAHNGKVGWVEYPIESGTRYELNNHSNMDQHAILFMVTQDDSGVTMSDYDYNFTGTFNDENEMPDYSFNYRIGYLSDHPEQMQLDLGAMDKGCVRQTQFGIAPGFYNLHNFGMNDFKTGGKVIKVKTLAPDFRFYDPDNEDMVNYIQSHEKDFWVEVTDDPKDNPRFYVLIGDKEWVEEVEEPFIEWAKTKELEFINIEELQGLNGEDIVVEEIEVEVKPDYEKLPTPEIEVEEIVEEENPVNEEIYDIPVEQEESNVNNIIRLVGLLVCLGLLCGCGFVAYKKYKRSQY